MYEQEADLLIFKHIFVQSSFYDLHIDITYYVPKFKP